MKRLSPITIIGTIISAGLIAAAYWHWLPTTMTEVFGFITGGWCVGLTVKENIWNWPIGIANSAFFLIIFFKAGLFADSSLQIFYIVLGFLGWYWWLHGGKNKTELPVSRTDWKTWLVLGVFEVAATWGFMIFLRSINDAAPFWDALTTVNSLVAQYLLTKKKIENWYVWLAGDIIYIWLYASRDLYLTSIIYGVFLTMCIFGLRDWRRSIKKAEAAESLTTLTHAPEAV